MLWIGLHLPLLSLESFAATLTEAEAGRPLALMDDRHIVSADAAAQALGVKAGLKRATALALAPHLLLGQADAWRDAQALTSVAHAALAFTPSVSLSSSDGVLLEVQASLRYFGGFDALLKRLRCALQPLRHRVQAVGMPTAQGAALLSRLHDGLCCPGAAALQQALDTAPAWLLGAGEDHWDSMQGMGLRTIGDVRRLPRPGLARRFGEALLHEIDRASGDRPDPRDPLVLPMAFHTSLELFARADTTEQLLFGAEVLLARLVAWLSAQHAFARGFRLEMKHERRWRHDDSQPLLTVLEVPLAEPSRDAAHLLVLLRERLAALQLPAPTLELALRADDIARQPPPNAELFPTPQSERAGLTRLIERLQARLGREQVQRLQPVADHRPERATCVLPADPVLLGRAAPPPPRGAAAGAPPAPSAAPLPITRPVWLLPRGLALKQQQDIPLLDGRPLQVLAGPERIESGWWDGELVERDYFVAQTPDGALLWLYRSRRPVSAEAPGEGWFLHGRFG
jgi:protein ImuB